VSESYDGPALADALHRAHHRTARDEALLRQHEIANNLWIEKTDWVQQTAQDSELGLHRADALRLRIENYEALLRQALEASQALIDRWDSPDWKDLPHTGTYILQLRKLVVALEQRLGEKG
jgi:hypothetical protein